jgi:glycyl-tRNA synthetase
MNMDDMIAFAKGKGFFWPTAEMYGGAAGLYDYGHMGALLKKRFESLWTTYFVESNRDYYLIDGSTMLPDKPLVASGMLRDSMIYLSDAISAILITGLM